MYELPTSVIVKEQSWAIRNDGDYRVVLDCFLALNDAELTKEERVISALMIFYEDLNEIEDVAYLENAEELYEGMVKFFNCGQENLGGSNAKLIDWEADAMLITSAVNKVAGKEIRAEHYLHWWTFMGYYVAIGECPLSTIVGIRHKKSKGIKLESYEKKFVQDNPQYFIRKVQDPEDIALDDWIRQQWEGGK